METMTGESRDCFELSEGAIVSRLEEIDIMLEQLRKRRTELQEVQGTIRDAESFSSERFGNFGQGYSMEAERAFGSLQWKRFGPDKIGEWAFVSDKQGGLVNSLRPIADVIERLKSGTQLKIGKYRYKISENGKFLNRFPLRLE
jgi:hypothetical protein